MNRSLVGVTTILVAVLLAAPASADSAADPTITIDPTSGPIGTVITASIGNCPPPPMGQEARLDFAFVGGTPAASEFFTPDPGGTAIVEITAEDKAIHADETAAEVNVYNCGGTVDGVGTAPFTVVRDQPASFDDVPAGHTHAAGVAWMVDQAITQGCTAQLFCPEASVTRGQIATFFQRAFDLPPGSVDEFDDVPADHRHAQGIGALVEAGITSGCAEGRYCPDGVVSRAQIATFLQQALDLPPGSVAQFSDVAPTHLHAQGIGAVAQAGITSGCTMDRYCPADPVTRGQTATLLMRALQ